MRETTIGIGSTGATVNSVQAHKGRIIRGLLAGLLPLILVMPAFAVGQWGFGLAISVAASFIAVGSCLRRHKPVTGLGFSSLGISVLLAIGYFGFGNVFFIQHFGVVIYGALLIRVLYGEIRGQPFTAQFSKQIIESEHWNTRRFLEGNRFLSRLWGVIFTISILMGVFGTGTLMLMVLPNALVLLGIVLGPNIGHWYVFSWSSKGAE